MKNAFIIVAILAAAIQGSTAFSQSNPEQQTIKVNGDDLSCAAYNGENYFYAELSGEYKIRGTIFSHHFTRFLFSDSCSQVDGLRGSTHETKVKVKAFPYQATICESGGSWYCRQYGCYQYRVEYVDMTFPNGLTLKSEVHTPLEEAVKIHDGQCSASGK